LLLNRINGLLLVCGGNRVLTNSVHAQRVVQLVQLQFKGQLLQQFPEQSLSASEEADSLFIIIVEKLVFVDGEKQLSAGQEEDVHIELAVDFSEMLGQVHFSENCFNDVFVGLHERRITVVIVEVRVAAEEPILTALAL
jgi:hypothetical protein